MPRSSKLDAETVRKHSLVRFCVDSCNDTYESLHGEPLFFLAVRAVTHVLYHPNQRKKLLLLTVTFVTHVFTPIRSNSPESRPPSMERE